MTRKIPQLNVNPKILAGIAAAIMLLLGLTLVVQDSIDTAPFKDQIRQIVKDRTGHELMIKGKVAVTLLPFPKVYIPNVELLVSTQRGSPPELAIGMIVLVPSVVSLFSGQLDISEMHLERPIVTVQQLEGGDAAWGWLKDWSFDWLKSDVPGARSISVVIADGQFNYHDRNTDRNMVLERIGINGELNAGQARLRGRFQLGEHSVSADLATDGTGLAGMKNLNLQLRSGEKDMASLNGTIKIDADMPVIQGKFALAAADMRGWLGLPPDTAQNGPISLSLTGDWSERGLSITLENMQMEGIGSAGGGVLSVDMTDTLAMSANIDFSVLDYSQFQRVGAQWFSAMADYARTPATQLYKEKTETAKKPIPENMSATINIKATEVKIDERTLHNAALDATLDKGNVTVNRLAMDLPGESTLSLFGIVSQSGAKGLRFEGSVETQGKSLRKLLTVWDASAEQLPESGFSAFYLRSNIFISPEQMRLSEADVKLNELNLSGGLVAYYDTTPRIEADVKLSDINFDYFRDTWREENKPSDDKQPDNNFFLQFEKRMDFSWLKSLSTNVDLKINVERFTFLERKGETASLRLYAKQGEIGIYDVRFYYPADSINAGLSLNVQQEKPFINLVFNASTLDTRYFSRAAAPEKETKVISVIPQAEQLVELPAEVESAPVIPSPLLAVKKTAVKKIWPEDLLDMNWMEGFAGSFDITLDRFIHQDITLNKIKFRTKLDGMKMTFEPLSFGYWDGRVDVNGALSGGKVPGISVGYTIYNADVQQMLKTLIGRDNIGGRVSLSGTLQTSGVNLLSWLNQSEARIKLSGRGIRVEGLDLQGVLDAVAVSRTSSDVLNNVNLNIFNGSTDLSVDGTINISAGVARTPGISLKTETIPGSLSGEAKLVPWSMELSSNFQFPSITSETVPTMTLQISGPIDAPSFQTDTSSLEAFVAKRIIGN